MKGKIIQTVKGSEEEVLAYIHKENDHELYFIEFEVDFLLWKTHLKQHIIKKSEISWSLPPVES